MTRDSTLPLAGILALLGLGVLRGCQFPVPAVAPCPEGSHERRFECVYTGRPGCAGHVERWYVCQKGEWVQE